jgi:hypothetical protein
MSSASRSRASKPRSVLSSSRLDPEGPLMVRWTDPELKLHADIHGSPLMTEYLLTPNKGIPRICDERFPIPVRNPSGFYLQARVPRAPGKELRRMDLVGEALPNGCVGFNLSPEEITNPNYTHDASCFRLRGFVHHERETVVEFRIYMHDVSMFCPCKIFFRFTHTSVPLVSQPISMKTKWTRIKPDTAPFRECRRLFAILTESNDESVPARDHPELQCLKRTVKTKVPYSDRRDGVWSATATEPATASEPAGASAIPPSEPDAEPEAEPVPAAVPKVSLEAMDSRVPHLPQPKPPVPAAPKPPSDAELMPPPEPRPPYSRLHASVPRIPGPPALPTKPSLADIPLLVMPTPKRAQPARQPLESSTSTTPDLAEDLMECTTSGMTTGTSTGLSDREEGLLFVSKHAPCLVGRPRPQDPDRRIFYFLLAAQKALIMQAIEVTQPYVNLGKLMQVNRQVRAWYEHTLKDVELHVVHCADGTIMVADDFMRAAEFSVKACPRGKARGILMTGYELLYSEIFTKYHVAFPEHFIWGEIMVHGGVTVPP